MVRSHSSPTLTLPNLIGADLAGAACLLSAEQLVQAGALLLRRRPQDPRAVCFLGGPLRALAGERRAAPNLVALEGDLGEDPFLVLAGPQAAVALLAVAAPGGFRARLVADPDLVDRAALVLAQFGDIAYSFDALGDPEPQCAFVAALAAAFAADPTLRGMDLAALFGAEASWLELARGMAAAEPAALLSLPRVRRLFQEAAVARATLGLLDADQTRLSVIASGDVPAPQALAPLPAPVLAAARARRIGSVSAADAAALPGELGAWAAGSALAAVPVVCDGHTMGLLLAASARPLTAASRAALGGLAGLLAAVLCGHSAARSAGGAPAVGETLAARLSGAPTPGDASTGGSRAAGNGTGGLAARLSGGARLSQPAPVGAASGRGVPAARARDVGATVDALIEHLSDGVVVVDGQGRLIAFTRTAMRMLALQPECRGRSLVESGAWVLASLFGEALTGELDGPREVELPTGQRAAVDVIAVERGTWAFVLHPDETVPALPEAAAAERLPAVEEGERSESFLANFSNIIRVPLRELRELITQVPALGNLNEQQSRLIGQVVRLNSEMTMLVNDLLALGQIRLETAEHRTPLRMDLLVEAAVGTQYAEFGRRGQHVTTEIEGGLPRVHGSEEGLGRAVAALIDNAIKYSPAGAQIKVAAHREGDQVVVAVQDNGPGLEAAELAQVFDPFYRAPSTEGLGVAGRGLGLTIAKAVVEQHGGRIWAGGAARQGCAFSFSIPCE